ncbi:hypothetical protein AX15_001199 [Amanita polypyramis BW_CC]|nr:hypothetical protein AX15_001199 [Amanita polypyramis BW_CC]
MLLLLIPILLGRFSANAAPLEPRISSITALSINQINAFTPYTLFASTAYCSPNTTFPTWSCGADCQANSDFISVASGGDGDSVQFWFVGYSPSLAEVIVAHQGTDTKKMQAILTDLDFIQRNLNPTLFPGVDSSVGVHSGFVDEQAKTASDVLSAVQSALSSNKVNKVTTVGHSLGAAIALLDGIYLTLQLPGVSVKTVSYGMPRVGNQAFANYVDAHLSPTHINNKKDPIPTLPSSVFLFSIPLR